MLKLDELLKALGADEIAPENPAHDIARERLEIERERLELAREQADQRAKERAARLAAQKERERLRAEELKRRHAEEVRARRLWFVCFLISAAFILAAFIFAVVALFA